MKSTINDRFLKLFAQLPEHVQQQARRFINDVLAF